MWKRKKKWRRQNEIKKKNEEDEYVEEYENDSDSNDSDELDEEKENGKIESEEENSCEDSENSSNDEKEILKSFNQFKKKFLPQLKTFFKASMRKKHKLYNDSIKNRIYFLAKNILSEKIPVEFSPEYGYILNRIVKRKMHSNDVKIALCEDYLLTGIFSKAIKLIEISKKKWQG